MLYVQLSSELIRVLPHAAQSGPQGLAVLPVYHSRRHVRGVPVRLLRAGVRRRVAGDLALFGPRLSFLRAVFVRRRVVGVAVSAAPESGEGLARLAAVFACDSRAAKAVEIPKFLRRDRSFFIFSVLRETDVPLNKYVKSYHTKGFLVQSLYGNSIFGE